MVSIRDADGFREFQIFRWSSIDSTRRAVAEVLKWLVCFWSGYVEARFGRLALEVQRAVLLRKRDLQTMVVDIFDCYV